MNVRGRAGRRFLVVAAVGGLVAATGTAVTASNFGTYDVKGLGADEVQLP